MKVAISDKGMFCISALALIELIKRKSKWVCSETTKEWFREDIIPDWKEGYEPYLDGFLKEKGSYESYVIKDEILYFFNDDFHNSRIDKDILELIEILGEKFSIEYHPVKIIEIPDDIKWKICESECGGGEWIAEEHRTWS